MGGFIISAILICAEYQRLGIHFRQHRILRLSFWFKLVFVVVEICLAAVYAGTAWDNQQNVAAVFEWIIALIFTFYVLTYFMDLLPASSKNQAHTNEELMHKSEIENGNMTGEGAASGSYTTNNF